ncbi:MAG: inositol 2-dehydrogenase [Caldilinea sp.]|nr:inositol 2-dehydrogenase [Caldilinea sp.]MDW8441438.1 inositol 2-dehydrogenase [Caldilineaceae bacterium]
MIGVAILGAGRISHVHARAVGEVGARLVAVYDVMTAAAEKLAERYGGGVEQSVEAVLARADVDAVIIATPTDTHVDYIIRCAEAGKAVLCEKPLAANVTEAQRCVDRVGHLQQVIQIGFNRRFDPSHHALQRALAAGEIGTLEQLIITSRDPSPPPAEYLARSGGLFQDMTIHDFDMARWLLQEPVTSVYAQGSCLVDPAIGALGDIDTATVVLRTASGKQCTILNSRRAVYGYDQRIEAHGEKGMLLSGNHYETSLLRFNPTSAGAPTPLRHFFLDRYADSYRLEIADFLDAVQTGRSASVSLQDGLEALRLAEAAQRSLRMGQPVTLQ